MQTTARQTSSGSGMTVVLTQPYPQEDRRKERFILKSRKTPNILNWNTILTIGRMTVLPPNSTALHISAKRLLSAKYSFAFRSFAPIHLLLCDVLLFNFLLHWVYRDETPMTDSGHKIYFPFMTGTYVIRLPYFPAAVNLLASFIFQQIQFCYPANS